MTTQLQEPSTRARGHGEFLKLWESNAPLTDDEVQLCTRVETECASLPLKSSAVTSVQTPTSISTSSNVATSSENGQMGNASFGSDPANGLADGDPTAGHTYKGHDGLKGLADVSTAEEFHAWHDEMGRRLQDANDEKYRAIISELNADRKTVEQLRDLIHSAETAVEGMQSGRDFVGDVVTKFKSDCENMVSERKKMGELADALRKRLTYFEELETLTTKLSGSDAVSPTHSDFVKLLHRLDECVAYASSSTGAVAEADGYLARFLDLQRRAFTSIRDYTVNTLRTTASTVAKELREDRLSGAGFRHADLTDASKEYLRFRTIAPRIKSLMTELRARSSPSNLDGVNGQFSSGGNAFQQHQKRMSVPNPASALVAGVVAGAGRRASITDPFSNPASTTSPRSSGNAASMSARNAALSLYGDCEECFFEERKRLLEPSVAAHIKSLADVRNMIALARLGSAYVLRVCQLERELYQHLFPVDNEGNGETEDDGHMVRLGGIGMTNNLELISSNNRASVSGASMLSTSPDENQTLLAALRSLCDMVYTELRPQILQEDDLDKLVYLIEVLKTEILGDEVPRRGFAGKAFAPSAIRAIADAQERIIYRAEVYMRDEIRGFIPQPEHLDYPNRILHASSKTATTLQSSSSPTKTTSNKNNNTSKKTLNNNNDMRSVGIYATWYPPVERTLRLLSMLYRCVEGEVFAGVAQEAVAMCVHCVGSAAARIAARGTGTDEDDSEDHAQLFLVWQLLMTREQISPFDVEMSYTEHELDFFELRALLGSVIRGRVSARALASRPTIRERVVDSKRDLDHSVRGACESFILKTTRTLLDPLLSFLAKCNALPGGAASQKDKITDSGGTNGVEGLEPVTPPKTKAPFDSLKGNAGSFAHPKRIKEMWAKVKSAIDKELPGTVDRMKIYITKAASRGVLLRPIRGNIAEAATELLSVLQVRYTLEERDMMGIDGGEVGKVLDNVDRIMGIGSS